MTAVPGPREVPPLLQTASRRPGGHILHTQTQTLQITTRCAGCAAAETGTAACGHSTDDHRRPPSPSCAPSTTATPSPPCHLQLPCRRTPHATTATSTPFRPPCPLPLAPEAVHRQPHPPTASSAWGGAVARQPLTTVLYMPIFS
jgi:hypothetical protein